MTAVLRLPLLAAVLSLAAVVPAAQAQTSQSASGSISVVSPPLVVAKTADLNFGTVAKPGSGTGTITIPTNSDTPQTANVTAQGTGQSRAAFTITGVPQANVNITVQSPMTLTRSGGSETMSIPLQSSAAGAQIGAGGTVTFYVGGTATLASSTVNGAYSGSFNVTVAYN